MTKWLIWALLLLVQNASFTWVSRARNSANVGYHAVAAIFSNGIWFASQFFVVDLMVQIRRSHSVTLALFGGAFYTSLTVLSSIAMHKFLMQHVEKGTRAVGAK